MRWPWRRDTREAELAEELQGHIEMAVAQRIERGESPAAARAHALREFGNLTHVAEVTRGMWGGAWWEALVRDVRHAARGLRRSPTFTAVAVATLALGIGASTAMLTIVNGTLLKPLPFRDPDRLVVLGHWPAVTGPNGRPGLSDHTFAELRGTTSRAFASLASFAPAQATLTGSGDAERLGTARFTANLTRTLGVAPALGRGFTEAEEQPGANHVVLLSDALWRERFGGTRSALGSTITLDGVAHTVIGVMPPSFDFPHGAALWTPLPVRPQPNSFIIRPVIARLSPGTSIDAATRELASTLERLPSTASEQPGTHITAVQPLVDLLVAQARPTLWIFSGAVTLVLLIACANVANLLLIRAATRGHEIGIRTALGAGRGRLIRQLVTESGLLACLGGAAGLVLSVWGVRLLLAIAPEGRIPRGQEIGVDWRVLAGTFAVALVAGVVCGIVPALASTRRNPRDALSASRRTVAGGHDRLRRVFVIAQLALAIVLASGAGLLLKSFTRMRAVDPGFRASGLVTFGVSLPAAVYPTPAAIHAFHARLLERLQQVPGVASASLVNWLPLGRQGLVRGDLRIEGVSGMPRHPVDKLVTAPGYFSTMGIRLVAGRDFDARDHASSLPVTIVTHALARTYWPPDGRGALGQRLTKDGEDDWNTVIGIVDDIVQQGVTEGRDDAQYFPLAQGAFPPFIRDVHVMVRTTRTAAELAPSLRAIVRELSPVVPARNIRAVDEIVSASMGDARFETRLLGIFAALALVLAAVGTYGVLAYDVAARTHELGVRVALGAVPRDVAGLVVRRTLALVMTGLLIGLGGALAVTRVLRQSLFEVTPTDPATLVAVSGVLLLVALIASLAPARRAMRIDPLTALRSE